MATVKEEKRGMGVGMARTQSVCAFVERTEAGERTTETTRMKKVDDHEKKQ